MRAEKPFAGPEVKVRTRPPKVPANPLGDNGSAIGRPVTGSLLMPKVRKLKPLLSGAVVAFGSEFNAS